MICYKDKTFCNSNCVRKDCYRFLSQEEVDNAERMRLPVALTDFSNGCFYYVSPEKLECE